MVVPLWKTIRQFLKNLIRNYHVDQQFHFWVYAQRTENRASNRYMDTNVHNSIVHNSQKVEMTQASMNK